MKYNLDLSAEDIKLIGDALDAMPHGKVSGLVRRVQAQIDQQEQGVREKAIADRDRSLEQWREDERVKIRAELDATGVSETNSASEEGG